MEKEKPNKISFESALNRLEEIVNILEEGDIPLEESLKLYEEGIRLYRMCMELLNQLQGKIEMIVREIDGSLVKKEFMPEDVGEDSLPF